MPQISTAPQSPQTLEHFNPVVGQDAHDSWLPVPHISLHSEPADSKEPPESTTVHADMQESLTVKKAMRSILASFLFSIATGLIGFYLGIFPALVALFFVIGSLFGHGIGAIETARSYAILKQASRAAVSTDC